MCNAWNHSASCTCGWGGNGHLGRRSSGDTASRSTSTYWWVPPITRSYESYVNPNASCPVCGAQVYFYQSPYGGRVFFDELGPPWPKHPCTDNSSVPPARTTAKPAGAKSGVVYAWQKMGWRPFIVTIIARMDKYLIKIVGNRGGADLTVYAKSVLVRHNQHQYLTADCIAQIREIRSESYEFSALTPHGTAVTFKVYASQIAARKDSGHKEVASSFTNSSSRGQEGTQATAENSVSTSGKVGTTSVGSAMSIAYAKALSKKQK